ncbi:MAG: excinuclease ABC subunit UvrC [Pseudomonadota bacterium]
MPMKSETAEAFDSAAFLKQVTEKPGVYQMYDANGDILYVGKASNLRKRLASYFRKQGQAIKTQSLVSRIADIQVTVTASETEALLLEQNLIKSQRPPYNILLRDDKSYPYIYLSNHSDYPSLTFRRGKSKRDKGTFFGPFPSGGAVRESLNILQKVFRIRNCSESYFRNRTRPCLQYQINRCTAPCVGMISPEEYQQDVRRARLFLQGKNPEIIQELMDAMEQASTRLDFERAAQFRDQINYLRHVQEQQAIEGGSAELDVIGLSQEAGVVCVVVLSVRGGRIVGTQHFFPRLSMDQEESELITAFIGQFYLGEDNPREIPREIIVADEIPDRDVLDQALSNQAGRDTRVRHRVRDERRRWLQMARTNAEETLRSHLSNKETVYRRLLALRELLEMDEIPARMECFDISHSQGENTVASCVVFDENGPLKSDYRLYNIEGETAGDDYAAMGQVLRRRYRRIKAGDGKRPDLVFIDGGLGQLNVARTVFDELGIDDITLIGVAKGEARRAGMEELIEALTENRFRVPPDSPALHLIQHIRDEAHRFAITGHRQRRDKKRSSSTLEGIPGVGPRRRRDLINYFGGLQELRKASVGEIAKVRGISDALAESIHSALHNE